MEFEYNPDFERALKLINFYNPSFTQDDLIALIKNGSIDYFLSAVNRLPKNYSEEQDAMVITKIINKFRD
jgi:hypothetical protein